MKKYLFILVIFLIFACGCVQMPESDETENSGLQETESATLSPTETAAPADTPQPEVLPFPDAMALETSYSYGDEKSGRIIAVDDAYIEDSYWYHSVAHGYDWEFKPQEGNKFVFIELWVKHNGTSRELGAPPAGSINLWYDGNFYSSLEEREGATAKITKPYNLWDDYYGGSIGRYEKRMGFLIYEVPESLSLDEAYIQAGLGNIYTPPVWNLG